MTEIGEIKVVIINYSHLEKVENTSLIVIKGFVEFYNCNSDVETCEELLLPLHDILEIQLSQSVLQYYSVGNKFTFVVELITGENAFHFIYKSTTNCLHTFILYYCPVAPELQHYGIIPFLINCSDSNPVVDEGESNATKNKIDTAIKLLQYFFQEKIADHCSYKKVSFLCNCSCKIICLPITKEELEGMALESVWTMTAKFIRDSEELWSPRFKYVGFLRETCNIFGGENNELLVDTLACGGGGLALFGFNCFETWPRDATEVVEKTICKTLITNPKLLHAAKWLGVASREWGDFYSASMGALAHELGHIFDLGHCERGIMGKDFNKFANIITSFETTKGSCEDCHADGIKIKKFSDHSASLLHSSARLLQFHRWFNTDQHGLPENYNSTSPIVWKNDTVFSKFPIVAVEIRDPTSGVVVNSLRLQSKLQLKLFKSDIPSKYLENKVKLISSDSQGNILIVDLKRSDLNNTYTSLKR